MTGPEGDGGRTDQRPFEALAEDFIPIALATRDRLRDAGHRAAVQDLSEAHPPSLRLLFWPRPGPLRRDRSRPRFTLELSWGSPEPGRIAVRRWTGEHPEHARYEGSFAPADVDSLWFHERIVYFIGSALAVA